jgi:succinate dehydrogenase/fumarate reductase flavoprotein subunit
MNSNVSFHKADVVVVGGGAAGSMAAIKARECGADVLLVDKSVFGRSGCAALASGGFSTYMPGDDIMSHLGGRGVLVNQSMAIKAIHQTYDLLLKLDGWGVKFVKENGRFWRGGSASGEPGSGGLAVGLLGGGPAMMKVVRNVALSKGVRVLNRVQVTDLLTSDARLPTKGHAVGVIGIGGRDAQIHVCQAKAIIVCAGGFNFGYSQPGQPFAGMPLNMTSDGLGLEFRAGAVLGNMAVGTKYLQTMEFNCAPGIGHLSVQGAKWVNRFGEPVIKRYTDAEQEQKLFARRLSLGNALGLEIEQGRGPVYLDLTHFGQDKIRFLRSVIPIIMQTFESAGYNLGKEWIPYIPVLPGTYGSTHGGGAVIDNQNMTSIPGLFAGGASSDGMDISPNISLSWCMCLGWWAGEHAADFSKQADYTEPSMEQVEELANKSLKHLGKEGITFEEVHRAAASVLKELGFVLNDTKISRVRDNLRDILASFENVTARDAHDLVKVLGLRNSVEVLPLVMEYLLHRKESRASIINADHPETDNENYLTLTRSRLVENGRLKIWDDPIPRDQYYVHYKPKPGKTIHPFFKAINLSENSPREVR